MKYVWSLADGRDVTDIVALSQQHFETEIDEFFSIEPPVLTRNLIFAVTNQFFLPGTELVAVARDTGNQRLIAWTWAKGNEATSWSDDPMVNVRIAHLDLDLSPRVRIQLVQDMMDHWERFARFNKNRIICSTTMRRDQDAFLRLHQRRGYTVRGSYCYKKLDAE